MITPDKDALGKAYANFSALEYNREEISIFFGVEEVRRPGQIEARVQLATRIVLNPFAAKRLTAQLDNSLREHELKFGPLAPPSPSPAEIQGKTSPGRSKDISGQEKTSEQADRLLSLIMDLNIETGLERSFKVTEQNLLKNRFIVGFNKDQIPLEADEIIIGICKKISMPVQLMNNFQEHLPGANYIHFGFEEDETSSIYKVYLEFWDRAKEAIANKQIGADGFDLHLGFKWDISDASRQAVTRYIWHPWISSGEIGNRVERITDPQAGSLLRQAAKDLVRLAGTRILDREILYLEVLEEENPRRSFDINVYRADLQVAEVYPILSVLGRILFIPYDVFHSFYEGIKAKKLGHLAAGMDRRGKPFFTVYYGVEPLYPEKFSVSHGEVDMGRLSRYTVLPRKKLMNRIEETDDKAERLYSLAKGLGFPMAFERSFKFMEGILLAGRFLAGFRRQPSLPEQDEAIMNLCRQIDMPEDHRERFRRELAGTDIVLFGFEANEKNRVYKAYLEFNRRLAEGAKQDPKTDKVHIHTGFKWDVSNNSRKAVATYSVLPLFRAGDIAKRVLTGFYADKKEGIYRTVDDIIDLAGSRTQAGDLLYFEVSEENNSRVSFDINMYRADLEMAELCPHLMDIARHYAVGMDMFDELYEGVRTHRLGHISGGTDREGRDFLTIYFAERPPVRDRSRPPTKPAQGARYDYS